jgi:hypothetical protein
MDSLSELRRAAPLLMEKLAAGLPLSAFADESLAARGLLRKLFGQAPKVKPRRAYTGFGASPAADTHGSVSHLISPEQAVKNRFTHARRSMGGEGQALRKLDALTEARREAGVWAGKGYPSSPADTRGVALDKLIRGKGSDRFTNALATNRYGGRKLRMSDSIFDPYDRNLRGLEV